MKIIMYWFNIQQADLWKPNYLGNTHLLINDRPYGHKSQVVFGGLVITITITSYINTGGGDGWCGDNYYYY